MTPVFPFPRPQPLTRCPVASGRHRRRVVGARPPARLAGQRGCQLEWFISIGVLPFEVGGGVRARMARVVVDLPGVEITSEEFGIMLMGRTPRANRFTGTHYPSWTGRRASESVFFRYSLVKAISRLRGFFLPNPTELWPQTAPALARAPASSSFLPPASLQRAPGTAGAWPVPKDRAVG